MLDLSAVDVVALDVDGTITNPDGSLNERTRSAIIALGHAGLPVILVTGRSLRNALGVAAQLLLTTPLVTCNGAVVGDPASGRILRLAGMRAADTSAVVEVHRRTALALTWWTADQIYITDDDRLRHSLAAVGERELTVSSPDQLIPAQTVKMMLSGTRQALDAAADDIGRAVPRAVRSTDVFFELSDARGTKWPGLSFALGLLGKNAAGCLGVGDGANDIGWLSRVGFPVAMADARPEVLASAQLSVRANPSDGLARLLESLLPADGR